MGLVSQTTGAPSFGSFETKRLPRYREKSTSACYSDIPSEEIEGPVENIIPVDAKVPGCAVRPQDVLAGVVSLLPKLLDAD